LYPYHQYSIQYTIIIHSHIYFISQLYTNHHIFISVLFHSPPNYHHTVASSTPSPVAKAEEIDKIASCAMAICAIFKVGECLSNDIFEYTIKGFRGILPSLAAEKPNVVLLCTVLVSLTK
jgi:hypothetical protein